MPCRLITPTAFNILVLLLVLWESAAAMETVSLGVNKAEYSIGGNLQYLEDPTGRLTLEEVMSPLAASRFLDSSMKYPNFGFTTSSYWFRITLRNDSSIRNRWFLHIAYPLLDEISFYQVFADGSINTQSGVPLQTAAFELELNAGEIQHIYLRTQTHNTHVVPVTLRTLANYVAYAENVQYLTGVYYGIVAALLLYNLLLFVSIRESIYLYYVGYLASFGTFMLGLNGYAAKYLGPDLVEWSNRATPFFLAIAALVAIKFTRLLLETPRVFERVDRILVGLMLASVAIAVASLLLNYVFVVQAATVLGFVVALTLLLAGCVCWRRKLAVAKFYVVAWTIFLIGSIIYALKSYGFLPANAVTEYSMQMGSALEVMLMSFALAYRIKLLKEENERVHHEANLNLEHRVAERTEELNNALGELSVANRKLTKLSERDNLTGVKNRQFFDQHLPKAWSGALRGNYSLAILVMDIDHFKQINDRYGHLNGDKVLQSVAATISENLTRSTDELVRYGGEEFVAVLPHTDEPRAIAVAERIRRAVSGLEIKCTGGKIPIRLSIGVAAAIPQKNRQPLELFGDADEALYEAKELGRDRVCVFSYAEVAKADAAQAG